jgi:hypothetical protein
MGQVQWATIIPALRRLWIMNSRKHGLHSKTLFRKQKQEHNGNLLIYTEKCNYESEKVIVSA